MPKFRVKGIGEVEIPDGSSREQAYEILQRAITPERKSLSIPQTAGAALAGIGRTVTSLPVNILELIGGVSGSQSVLDAARDIRDSDIGRKLWEVPENYRDRYASTAGELAGNLMTMIGPGAAVRAAGMAPGVAKAAYLLPGVALGASEQVQRAEENRNAGMEVPLEDEVSSARMGAATGLLDLIPYGRFLGKSAAGLNLAKEAAGMTIGKQALRSAKTGAAEGVTELLQQLGQNAIEKRYNENQSLKEGLTENAAAGLGVGAIADLILGRAAKGTGKRVMARREALASQPIEALSDADSIGIRRGEGGDPLVELLARTQREQKKIDLSLMPVENYGKRIASIAESKLPEKEKAALGSLRMQQKFQQTMPTIGVPIDPSLMPVENYRKKQEKTQNPAQAPEPVPLSETDIQPIPMATDPEVPVAGGVSVKITSKGDKFKVFLADQAGDQIGSSWTYADKKTAEAKGAEMLAGYDPRLSLGSSTATAPTPYTIESLGQEIKSGKKPEIALDVFSEMQRLGVDDLLSTRLIDNLGGSQGRYANRVVDLALNGRNKADLLRTLNHEAVHGMKQMGLFTNAEWDLLNSSFNPNNALTEEERTQYADLYKDPVKVQEEAVARGIERYAAGEMEAPPVAVSVAAKALGSIDRLGNVLRGKGFQNTDDVLKSFRSGEIGGRELNDNQIANRPAGEQVSGAPKDQQAGVNSTSLADYLTEPEAAEDTRHSIVPQLPVVGGSKFAASDERSFLRKAYDTFVKPSGLGGIGLRGRQNVLDMRAGIEALGRKAGRTDARTGSEPAVRNFDVSQDFASSALKNGALEYVGTSGNGYFRSNGDTANAPVSIFTDAYQKGKLDRLFHYIAAERSDELLKEGREKNITPQEVAAWKAYGQDPEIAQYARRWKAFNDQMIDTLQKSGRINAATAADWKGKAYLPYYRVVDEDVSHQSSGSTLASAPRLERLKGSELDIADPSDNIARNVSTLTAMAMKNEAMQRVARDGIQTGYIKQVPQPVAGKPNMKLWVDGKEKHFEVLDPILYESITASRIPNSVPLAIAGFPSKVLREGVTLDPVFMGNNLVRDSTMAWLQGYTDFPMQKIIQSTVNAIGNRPSFQAMERAGVIGNSIRGEGGAAGTGRNMRERYKNETHPIKALQEASRKSEGITRNAVYEAVLKRTGGDEAQAQYEARELLNFNRRGAAPVVQWVNALIPFQNAAWQGTDVLYRGLRGRGANPQMQKQLAARMATLFGLSVGYTILASGMEEWQNATDEERDANWILPGGAKVKIPFEAGYIAKILPERITALYMGTDTGKEFIGAFRRFLESTLKVDAIPQFAKPAMEVRSNYSSFRGKEVEPSFMSDREKGQRFDDNTTELAKKIGEHTDVLSPLQIDHLLRGYLGSIGTYGVQLAGLLANPDKAAPSLSMAEREPNEIPVLGRFFQPKLGSKQLVDFYETADRGEQAKNALKAGLEPTKERVDLATYEQAQRPVKLQIAKITKAEKQIRAEMGAGRMSPEAARPMLREYRKAKIDLAKEMNRLSLPLR